VVIFNCGYGTPTTMLAEDLYPQVGAAGPPGSLRSPGWSVSRTRGGSPQAYGPADLEVLLPCTCS